jgi:pimeloyl-ACP methyl ester carboxylesterase
VVFDQLDAGAHLSAACADDASPAPDAQGTFLGDYRARMYRQACAVWPRATPPGRRTTLAASVPVLIVSGALDPVTPPRFAEAVARALPNATVLTVPGMAHAAPHRCVEDVVAAFVSRASMQGVDTSCVKEITVPAFVTR